MHLETEFLQIVLKLPALNTRKPQRFAPPTANCFSRRVPKEGSSAALASRRVSFCVAEHRGKRTIDLKKCFPSAGLWRKGQCWSSERRSVSGQPRWRRKLPLEKTIQNHWIPFKNALFFTELRHTAKARIGQPACILYSRFLS